MEKLKSLMVGAVVGIASIVGGCSSDTGSELTLVNWKIGHQQAFYRKGDDRSSTDFNLFKRDCSPYDRSQVSDGFFKHYSLGKE